MILMGGTTIINTSFTLNVSSENDTLNIGMVGNGPTEQLGAISWTEVTSDQALTQKQILKYVRDEVEKCNKYTGLWLFVGDSNWQVDNRIIRHKKLFRRLADRGYKNSDFIDSYEMLHESGNKLRYFGAVEVADSDFEWVIPVLRGERCSYLVFVPSEFNVEKILRTGWDVSNTVDVDFVSGVIGMNGLVLKITGSFDDIDAGFICVGGANEIELLATELCL